MFVSAHRLTTNPEKIRSRQDRFCRDPSDVRFALLLRYQQSVEFKVPKVTRVCHPEAQPKDLGRDKEILRFAQNDSFAVTLAHFGHFWLLVAESDKRTL